MCRSIFTHLLLVTKYIVLQKILFNGNIPPFAQLVLARSGVADVNNADPAAEYYAGALNQIGADVDFVGEAVWIYWAYQEQQPELTFGPPCRVDDSVSAGPEGPYGEAGTATSFAFVVFAACQGGCEGREAGQQLTG